MTHYIIIEQLALDRTRYGVAAVGEQGYVDRIDDVALTMEEAVRLTGLLAENGVAAEHFHDVIEDHLAAL